MNSTDSVSPERRFNTRLGLWLFAVYLVLYLGFVLISAFAAEVMDTIIVAGLNLAIVYGLALIVIALALALMYGLMCRREPSSTGPGESQSDGSRRESGDDE